MILKISLQRLIDGETVGDNVGYGKSHITLSILRALQPLSSSQGGPNNGQSSS